MSLHRPTTTLWSRLLRDARRLIDDLRFRGQAVHLPQVIDRVLERHRAIAREFYRSALHSNLERYVFSTT